MYSRSDGDASSAAVLRRDEEQARQLEKYIYFIKERPALGTPRELTDRVRRVPAHYPDSKARARKKLPDALR